MTREYFTANTWNTTISTWNTTISTWNTTISTWTDDSTNWGIGYDVRVVPVNAWGNENLEYQRDGQR